MLKTIRPPLADAWVHGEVNMLLGIDLWPVHVSICIHLRYSCGKQMWILSSGIARRVKHCHIKSVSLPQLLSLLVWRAVVPCHLNYVMEASHLWSLSVQFIYQKWKLMQSNICMTHISSSTDRALVTKKEKDATLVLRISWTDVSPSAILNIEHYTIKRESCQPYTSFSNALKWGYKAFGKSTVVCMSA